MGLGVVMQRDLLAILGLGGAFAVFYAVAQSWGWWLVVSTDLLFDLVSGVAAVFALLVLREDKKRTRDLPNLRERLHTVHVGFFLAILLWFLGEFTWSVYELVLGVQIPYPSIADVFYLAAYVPAFVSIFGFMRIFQRLLTPLKKLVSLLVGASIVGLTAIFLLTPLSVSSSPLFVKAFDVSYPILDAALMILVTMRLIAFNRTFLGRPWIWIFSGLLLLSFADIMFSWGALVGWYYSGHPIELLWLYGYLALALGFNRQRTQLYEPT